MHARAMRCCMLCGRLRKKITRAATRQLTLDLRVHCRNNNAVASDTTIYSTRHGVRVGTRLVDSVCELRRPGPYICGAGPQTIDTGTENAAATTKEQICGAAPQARDTGTERAEATAKLKATVRNSAATKKSHCCRKCENCCKGAVTPRCGRLPHAHNCNERCAARRKASRSSNTERLFVSTRVRRSRKCGAGLPQR